MDERSAKQKPASPAVAADQSALLALARTAGEAHEALIQQQQATIDDLRAQIRRYEAVMENITAGVCFFDREKRLLLSNSSYAAVYHVPADRIRPGISLQEVIEERIAAGTAAMSSAEYLSMTDSINAGAGSRVWRAALADGRVIQVRHSPSPDGGWISTHEDVTEMQRELGNERLSLQALIDWVPDNLWVKDPESRFVIANRATATRMGKQSVGELLGKTDLELCPPETGPEYYADERRIIASGQPMIDKEEYVLGADDEKTWILTTKVPLRSSDGKIVGLAGISRDISERRRADLLRESQARILEKIALGAPLEGVLDSLISLVETQIPGAVGSLALADADGQHLRTAAAPNVTVSFARGVDESPVGRRAIGGAAAVYRRRAVIVSDIVADPQWDEHRDLISRHGYRSCWALPIASHSGRVLGALTLYSHTVRAPREAEIRICEAACHIAGIAIERKLAEEHIRFMASHDALTGLPNRTLLPDRIEQALRFAKRAGHWATVAFIDLDNFKIINDMLGHNAGDELLKTIADRMVSCLRSIDTVVRMGGDEFAVVLFDQPPSTDNVAATIRKLQEAIVAPLTLAGQTIRVTSSIGVASFPRDGTEPDALLANADAAMYRAKELGRDTVQFYEPDLNTRVREEFLLQEDLRGATARHEFVLHYQPQIDVLSGKVFAVEALIRWNHPVHGMIVPDRFIPIAEATGMIVPIGDWVLNEACRQNKAWQDAGLPVVVVSVNVSARQFADKTFVARVIAALKKSGLEPRYLELELTESLIMRDMHQAVATMEELRRLGVLLAIDDFGTGYSSLAALKSFPVARIKIDKSFIKELPTSVDDRAVATAVISLGKKLNLRVVAEGVENEEQIDFLRRNNCDELQGFHFSRPIPPDELGRFLTRGPRKD